jgi:energy-coupling factor transport system ATP-binding protein
LRQHDPGRIALGHPELDRDRVDAALAEVGLQNLPLHASPQSLSGGQQRRLALAVQLIRQPYLLLLDEPTAGLDWSMREQLIELLAKLKKDWTLLIVTHEPKSFNILPMSSWSISHGAMIAKVEKPVSLI